MSLRHLLIASFLLLIPRFTRAQVTQLSDATAPPTPSVVHNYIGMLNETVNPTAGALAIYFDAPPRPVAPWCQDRIRSQRL